jgi:hypothetical protein
MGKILRGSVREGLVVLQVLPVRFLRSSPSRLVENRHGLPHTPLWHVYVLELHSLPWILDLFDYGAGCRRQRRGSPPHQALDEGGFRGGAIAQVHPCAMGPSQGPRHFPAVACGVSPFKLMPKGVFLMSFATARRASELQALLCVHLHFRQEGENLRFIPSRLTKTDRPGCLTPQSTSSLGKRSCVCAQWGLCVSS